MSGLEDSATTYTTDKWFSAPEGLTECSQGWSAAQPLAGVREMGGSPGGAAERATHPGSVAPPKLVGWLALHPGVALEDSLHPWLQSHAPPGLKQLTV